MSENNLMYCAENISRSNYLLDNQTIPRWFTLDSNKYIWPSNPTPSEDVSLSFNPFTVTPQNTSMSYLGSVKTPVSSWRLGSNKMDHGVILNSI